MKKLYEQVMEETHVKDKCMRCNQPPTIEVMWADGRARAWFCDKHFEEWKNEEERDIIKQRKVTFGKVGKKWGMPAREGVVETTSYEFVHKVLKQIFNKYPTQMKRAGLDVPKDLADEVYSDYFMKIRSNPELKGQYSSVLAFIKDEIDKDKKQFIKNVLDSLK